MNEINVPKFKKLSDSIINLGRTFLILICILSSCVNKAKKTPDDIIKKLDAFGSNKDYFIKMIRKAEQDDDSLMLKSLYFIIGNLKGAKSIDLKRRHSIYDIDQISPDFLFKNITSALNSSKKKINSNSLSFEDFCEYVLPHRIKYEKLEDWRSKTGITFSVQIDSLNKAGAGPTEICRYFNIHLAQGFKFKNNPVPGDFKNWTELSTEKTGNCFDMTKIVLYPLRAMGIPVTTDFTPSWGNVNGGGHAWNALIMLNGRSVPFMGLETEPGQYDPFLIIKHKTLLAHTLRLPAKVFRNRFSLNDSEFPTNAITSDSRLVDVTEKYVPVTDAIIRTREKLDSRTYLCVYSDGVWNPTYWSKERNGSLWTFSKMARNMLYLPSQIILGGPVQIAPPFILQKNGKIQSLDPNRKSRITINVETVQSIEADLMRVAQKYNWKGKRFFQALDSLSKGMNRTGPVVGNQYTLYLWDKKWEAVSKKRASSSGLVFSYVPDNALYKISADDTDNDRPFTYKNGKQEWW